MSHEDEEIGPSIPISGDGFAKPCVVHHAIPEAFERPEEYQAYYASRTARIQVFPESIFEDQIRENALFNLETGAECTHWTYLVGNLLQPQLVV